MNKNKYQSSRILLVQKNTAIPASGKVIACVFCDSKGVTTIEIFQEVRQKDLKRPETTLSSYAGNYNGKTFSTFVLPNASQK
jgi:hypothetical protein